MPLYTLRNKTTGELTQVTDPGRALIDGKWSHIGRFKGPMLRDLARRVAGAGPVPEPREPTEGGRWGTPASACTIRPVGR
jgi:hypothetical protein